MSAAPFVVAGVIITTLSGESLHRFDGESITPALAPFSSLFTWPLTADGGRANCSPRFMCVRGGVEWTSKF